MARPASDSFPEYFGNYIKKVVEDDVLTAIENQQAIIDQFLPGISEEKAMFAYSPGKWTLKEMVQHLIDAERVFAYRALCFARGEQQSLPGFEENAYAAQSDANRRSWESLCYELKVVRKSTRLLFESFTPDMINREGMANNRQATVNALGFVIVGHLNHHKEIIETRYLLM